MTVTTFSEATSSLPELVDGIAGRTGAWLVIERCGSVVAHGTGAADCPAAVVMTLVSKRTAHLRGAVTWHRGRGVHLRGTVEGLPLSAVELGDGVTAWFIGGGPEDGVLSVLAAAAHGEETPVTDPAVEALLHPRGPRRGLAPLALLLAVRHDGPPAAVSRRAAFLVAGTTARVHTEGGHVLVALPVNGEAETLQELLGSTCPGVVVGAARVEEDASDWARAWRLATAAAKIAAHLGLSVAHPSDPVVALELVLAEAREAVADLARSLPDSPLRTLQEHDRRSAGGLVLSLTAWCRAGFDVPEAAAALHVHPNTLRYRLKRATELCGLDLTRPRQLVALQLLLEL